MNALRILAVEDNPADFRLLTEYLGESPSSRFEIVRAGTLKEALELLSGGEFDAVMLDLNLPDSFGLEGLESLVKVRTTVPHIVLTGADKPEIGLLSLSKGAQDYLVKGKIDSDALIRSIRYAIERNKAEEAVRQMNAELAKRAAAIEQANIELQSSRLAALNLMEDAIEARQRAEQSGAELAIVSERLAFAQQSAGAGTWNWDMLSDKLDWSPELFRLFGLDPAARGASFDMWTDVILPEDRKIAADRIEQAIQSHTRLVNEYRIVFPTGEVRWINALGDTTYDTDGKPIRMSGICLDITDRKRVDEALRQTLKEIELYYDTAPAELCVLDTDLRFTKINKHMAEINGMPVSTYLGRSVREIMPHLAETIDPACHRVIESGAPWLNLEITEEHPTPSGIRRTWLSNLYPLKDLKERVVGINVVMEEITERKRAEEALKNARDKLEERVKERTTELSEANKKLRRYQDDLRSLTSELLLVEERERKQLAAALHDSVGQLLALMKIKLGALSEQLSSKTGQIAMEEALNMADQTIRLVRNLTVELSPPVLYQLGLPAALEELGDRLTTDFGIRLAVDDQGCPRHLDEALRTFLFQSIRELITNIGKHSKAVNACLTLTPRDQALDVVIEDDGVGFDPSKVVDSRSFGLFSVRERMFHIGGTMKIESEPGRGTRIMLSVPLPAPAKKDE